MNMLVFLFWLEIDKGLVMKKNLKNLVMVVMLVGITFTCSGCWTALGAIIGHQSGELLAGAIIGAGIDVGLGVAKEADRQSENLKVEREKGKIFAKLSANGSEFVDFAEKVFDGEGWDYVLEFKKVRKNKDSEARWTLNGKSEISIKVKDKKLNLKVKAADETERAELTGKLAELLNEKFCH